MSHRDDLRPGSGDETPDSDGEASGADGVTLGSDGGAGSRPVVRIGPDGIFAVETASLDRALALVSFLRAEDEWDRKQTARTLVPHLLEEAHEAADAIREGDPRGIAEELGDLLLNVAFQIVVAEESRVFDREAVMRSLESKMVRRHPHVFGDGPPADWEILKAADRSTAPGDGDAAAHARGREGALDGIPRSLPPLVRAHRVQQRAAAVGFDWEKATDALEKVREEIEEVADALRADDPEKAHEEIGDLLFSVVNVARLAGTHAHVAMEAATAKFETRFRSLETLAARQGVPLPGATLERLDRLWDEVKALAEADRTP